MLQKKIEEIITENFPNLIKGINLKTQDTQWTPNRTNSKKSMPSHIVIKLLTTIGKEKVLQAAREKQHITYKRIRILMTADFSSEAWRPVGSGATALKC